MNRVVETVGDSYRKAEVPEFEIGDTVDVHVRIKEGERERIQIFSGTVIARRGRGVNASFTVRHLFQGEGVERHPVCRGSRAPQRPSSSPNPTSRRRKGPKPQADGLAREGRGLRSRRVSTPCATP